MVEGFNFRHTVEDLNKVLKTDLLSRSIIKAIMHAKNANVLLIIGVKQRLISS